MNDQIINDNWSQHQENRSVSTAQHLSTTYNDSTTTNMASTSGQNMSLRCLCGSAFDTAQERCDHEQAQGHYYFCSCGTPHQSPNSLQHHQLETSHTGRKTRADFYRIIPFDPSFKRVIVRENIPANVCPLCNKTCANAQGVEAHIDDIHAKCPMCSQRFRTKAQCVGHQRVTGHCYCDEHDTLFSSRAVFYDHIRDAKHASSYECVDCDRSFGREGALKDHLESRGHAAVTLTALERAAEAHSVAAAEARTAAREEESLRCEACHRDFKTVQDFWQHKASTKHNPLSDLKCPMSEECMRHFTSPSALLNHLESGGCRSGMNRLKLNALIHAQDTERQITNAGNVSNVLTSATAANAKPTASDLAMSLEALSIGSPQLPARDADAVSETTTTCEGVLVEDISDTESVCSGVLIRTPSLRSRTSSIFGGVMLTPSQFSGEWSFVNIGLATPSTTSIGDSGAAVMQYDAARKAWPCVVEGCEKTFKKQDGLMQHLNSAYHTPKLFRCPNGLVMEGQEHERVFKTISGFAMHLESGNCVGGKDALQKIVGLFEEKIQEATGSEVKLLKNSTRCPEASGDAELEGVAVIESRSRGEKTGESPIHRRPRCASFLGM